MKRVLKQIKSFELALHYFDAAGQEIPTGNLTGNVSWLLRGNVSWLLRGDVSGLRGDVSGLTGNVSGLTGDVDDADLSLADREKGIAVTNLVVKE